ncbi:hypothetical protein VTJ83DRAFT_549 [Remersonia thermophila]|uniref:C2H2-type domain-containing protein n=1 Tax=Remersonia thermophila TaxID=72144 RepID=A0ABR4DLD0_9PEZI
MSSSAYAFPGDQFDHTHGTATQDPHFLNPFSPSPFGSRSGSPALHTHTPAESVSSLSVHYQSSELSEGDDPFFGIDFGASLDTASPSFLNDAGFAFHGTGNTDVQHQQPQQQQQQQQQASTAQPQHAQQSASYLPLSPDKSPSIPGNSPDGPTKAGAAARGVFPDLVQTSVAPQELSLVRTPPPAPANGRLRNASVPHTNLQLTPQTDGSAGSSDDGVAPPPAAAMMSPRVTVSHWDGDAAGGYRELPEQTLPASGRLPLAAARDDAGRWIPDPVTGQAGLAPAARVGAEVDSVNDLAKQRKVEEKNQAVGAWLERSTDAADPPSQAGEQPAEVPTDLGENIPDGEIALGDKTQNKAVPGQTYFIEQGGGELKPEDLELMRKGRNWEDAPVPLSISRPDQPRYQPESSQAAIERYQQQCRDTDSMISRSATWGTQRLSLPNVIDPEVQEAGNFLKKLSLGRGEPGARRPSILQGIRSLVKMPSANASKRKNAEHDDATSFATESSAERKEAAPAKLAPPSPKPSWPRKQSIPSINTAFIDVASAAASIGTTHARASSISTPPVMSPKSPISLNLSVKKPLTRLRSKSEASSIVDLWKRSGGPPVSSLANAVPGSAAADDDDDDDDELYEDGDMRDESTSLIDDITPSFAGFQEHIIKLNPMLADSNRYLVERIAYQQLQRYKGLLNLRVKHLQAVNARTCNCGTMCIASGGSANPLDGRGSPRGLDPLSGRFDGSDGDVTPLEGAINQESFPQDIPMPPTASLPAEFECQLCFVAKKFQKPSDWTKHVHEDVQPFTCTWERCREPKMFKRKADWVRHENEGHRHLEWWVCDVDDCRHKCYRRDNFLQHLVREHKFVEPKVKTKAAIKRAGGTDPTWVKVEQCHQETSELPQDEPCRFCGKTFPTWKKLTVHVAKHMERISLPVLRLVAQRDLTEDTVISPVQDPPPRPFPPPPLPSDRPQQQQQQQQQQPPPPPMQPIPFVPSSGPVLQAPMPRQVSQPMLSYGTQGPPPPVAMYSVSPPSAGYPTGFFSPSFDDLAHDMAQAHINNMSPVHPAPHQFSPHPPMLHHPHPHPHQAFQSLNSQAAFAGTLPVTSAPAAAATGPALSPATPATAYMPSPQQTAIARGAGGGTRAAGYVSMPATAVTTPVTELEPFPVLSMDALGLGMSTDPTSAVVAAAQYHAQAQQAQQQQQQQHQQHHQQQQQPQPQQQFSPQGQVSPYGHSPNVPQAGFY